MNLERDDNHVSLLNEWITKRRMAEEGGNYECMAEKWKKEECAAWRRPNEQLTNQTTGRETKMTKDQKDQK